MMVAVYKSRNLIFVKKINMDVSPSLSFSFRSFVFLSNTPRLHSRGGFWSADRHTQEQTATLHSMLFFFVFSTPKNSTTGFG